MKISIRKTISSVVLAAAVSTAFAAAAAPAGAATAPTSTIRPTVAYAGATCVKVDASTWKVTMRWTATGGRYTDFDDYAGTRARVTTTQARTWIKTIKVYGFGTAGAPVAAPTTVYGRYSHRIAPYLWNGYQTSVTTLNSAYVTAPVSCPA
jgi:hypothetical protein